jgi:hypothetical protein
VRDVFQDLQKAGVPHNQAAVHAPILERLQRDVRFVLHAELLIIVILAGIIWRIWPT